MHEPFGLTDEDLQELFALFSSPTEDEIRQVYTLSHRLFFKNENLDEEYELHQEKREYALDAWRAVLLFLDRREYEICKLERP